LFYPYDFTELLEQKIYKRQAIDLMNNQSEAK
jgi:hypothetical protein